MFSLWFVLFIMITWIPEIQRLLRCAANMCVIKCYIFFILKYATSLLFLVRGQTAVSLPWESAL